MSTLSSAPLDVVFLHGVLGVPEQWHQIASRVARPLRTHTPELDLFSRELDETTVGHTVDRVMAWLERERIDRFVAVGNSMGGQVALHLALRLPGRAAGLVLAGSSGLMERHFDLVQRRPSHAFLRSKVEEVFFDPRHATDMLVDHVIAIVEDTRTARRLVRLSRSIKQDPVGRHLYQVTCPVLLVWGTEDCVTPPAVAHEFHRRLPNADLVFLPACGHVPMVEHPEAFSRELARFLTGLQSAAARAVTEDAEAPTRWQGGYPLAAR